MGGIILVPDADRRDLRHELRQMPELGWRLGYPFALGLMAGSSLTLYLVFKKKRLALRCAGP